MKCIVLAGGTGERLWPLSRKNCPKQFIEIENSHSLFQNTIARNIPYCDEFIIVTNINYKYIVENQLEPFQGLNYRCIYEEKCNNTTAAVVLSALSIEPYEYIMVTNCNMLISAYEYKDSVLRAKKNAFEGYFSIFVNKEDCTNYRYGYVLEKDIDGKVSKYKEKPFEVINGPVYKNLGFLIFQNGVLLSSLPVNLLEECKVAYKTKTIDNGYTLYSNINVTPISIEKSLLENSNNLKAIEVNYPFRDIRSLDDLFFYNNKGKIINNSKSSKVINTSKNKAIVVNGIDNLIVVNTDDALYIGEKTSGIKDLLKDVNLKEYGDKSNIYYRSWGVYEDLVLEKEYRLRKLTIKPGKTIYEHVHEKRTESWTVLKGSVKFTLESKEFTFCNCSGDSFLAREKQKHQISNIGNEELILVETAVGDISNNDISATSSGKITDKKLGLLIEPFIKLTPALKDYLWGGDQLKSRYNIICDLDIVAEAWLLSAHPDGESIIATGKYKGYTLSKYIETVGKEVLGWKCEPLQSFPMLVKFIDAKGNLSIQVHPDDDFALDIEDQYGKNEMWYVVDSKPGSGLYVGFNKNVSKDEVRDRVKNNTITDVLNFYPTKPGDIFFIPAGTVHAICEGNLICEIQQSSNCTYRLYDYDRRDKFGNPRELHLEKALEVLNFNKYEAVQGNVSCKYFETEIIDKEELTVALNDERFLSIICIDGTGYMSVGDYSIDVNPGDSIFVPAQNDIMKIKGKMKLAISHI